MKNMTLSSLPLILIGCTIVCSGFDFRCPVSSEWRLRSKSTCRNTSLAHYYCMFDDNNNVYREFCRVKNDFQGAGKQFVFRGNPDGQNCFDDRYQPILFWTNGSSECILLKSQCQGTGSFVYDNGSTSEDRTCRCDHRQGYAFVSEPRNPCYCIPSQEDCSCYRKQCNKTSTLSPDYTCIPKDLLTNSICHTKHAFGYVAMQRPTSENVPDTTEHFVNFKFVNNRYVPQIVVLVLTVIFVIIGVLGFLVISCCTPSIHCEHEVYYTSENQTVQIEFCVVSFMHVSFEIVTTNGVSQLIDPRHVDGKRKYSFRVANLKYSDSGVYTCYVSNWFGTEQCQSKLLVGANPRFDVSLPFDVSIPEGEVVLTFKTPDDYNGIPVKSVSWKRQIKDDMVTVASTKESTIDSRKYRDVTLKSPFLRIMDVTPNDAGKYSCYISNGKHEISASIMIVLDPPLITTEEIFYNDIKQLRYMELRCHVSSNVGINSLRWQKSTTYNVIDISSTTGIGKYAGGTADTPTLTIYKPDSDDAGTYTCIAINICGTTRSAPFVIDRPEIQNDDVSCYTEIGSLCTIKCNVSSTLPITKVTWERTTGGIKTLVEVKANAKFQGATPENPSLIIMNVDTSDLGSYICFAANPVGTVESQPITLTNVKDSLPFSPPVLLENSVKESIKKSTGTRMDETDWGKNLHFAQVTDDDVEKARQEGRRMLEEEMRIVFVGKIGVGKSSTANTILGYKHFPCGISFTPVTEKCMIAKTVYRRKHVKLIDTPGIFALDDNEKETEEKIKRCIHLAGPGPHAILLVIEYGCFRREDLECINTFLKYFGDGLKKYVIVVFTHVDKMEENETINGMIEKFPILYKFIEECGDRYCKFNNNGSPKEKEDQIGHLFALISKLKTTNDFMYFTDDSILRAEERVREKVKEVEFDVREDCKRKHLQEIKKLQEQMESTESPKTKTMNMMEEQYKRKREELVLECERDIEHAREKARKEFEDHEQFSGFSLNKNKKNQH